MLYKILVLEDNELLVETLEEFLVDSGYYVKIATKGSEALKLTYEDKFDLYLLDVKVPDITGFEFLKDVRESGDQTPAIFLTSLNEQESLAKGFSLGGDDYIKKPFDLDELLFRIRAVLSRSYLKGEDIIDVDGVFSIHKNRKRVYKNGEELSINLKDFELLCLLVENMGKVVTKEMIIEHLWKNEEPNAGSIRVYITNLKKIFGKDRISNLRGIGYRFEEK